MGKEELMERPLTRLPIAAIDFESAGAAPGETDQPVQIGIVRANDLYGKEECFVSYIACSHPVRWSAARIHGITTSKLQNAPSFASLWPDIRRLLSGCVVIGHNPSTEKRFLKAFPCHGFGPWLDTLALARHAMPSLPNHSLSTVCDTLGTTPEIRQLIPGRQWHDALFDAAASLCLFRTLVRELDMGEAPLHGLSFALTP